MDDIFTLVLIIIAIVSTVIKAKSKPKDKQLKNKSEAKAAAGELGAKLRGFFADMQEKFEAQTLKGRSGLTQQRRLTRSKKKSVSAADSDEMSLEDLVLEDEQPEPAPVKSPPPRPAALRAEPSVKPPVTPQPDPTVRQAQPSKAPLDPAFLRNAVIWSEIIGPPVALRDFPEER